MIKNIFILLIIVMQFSCGNNERELKETNNKGEKTPKFKILYSTNYNYEKLDYKGKIVNTKTWQDTNGENIVLFTKNKMEIFVYHYAIKNNNTKLLRKVQDNERNCEFDGFIDFVENSIFVTDLNSDNYGEITFAYKKNCSSDVSPKTLKLITIENGDKYIIRGSTHINFGKGQSFGGEKKIDKSFKNGPSVFLNNANKIWKNIVEEKYY